ncbi:hypothetical protein Tco_0836694 [Tanacetum coccineum]
MIALSSFRYSSNDIVHNHYPEEAKKKAQEHSRILEIFSLLQTLCLLDRAPFLNVQKTFDRSKSSLGHHGNDVCSHQFRPHSSSNDIVSYITTRVGITIPLSHSNVEDNSHKVVRLGINPMIQPEPEDLPKDNPKLEIAVLRFLQSVIGSLMYLNASRPDIMFAVCLWNPRDSPFELEAFSDSDYGGASLDRKSTTGGCQFLGRRYLGNARSKLLWQILLLRQNMLQLLIVVGNVIKNPVAHSRTKHIEIRFHFIRDCYEKRLIEVIKIHTDSNVADLLTKGFDVTRFNFLVVSIGLLNL